MIGLTKERPQVSWLNSFPRQMTGIFHFAAIFLVQVWSVDVLYESFRSGLVVRDKGVVCFGVRA